VGLTLKRLGEHQTLVVQLFVAAHVWRLMVEMRLTLSSLPEGLICGFQRFASVLDTFASARANNSRASSINA
jgi:hypothetical protein